MQCNAMHLAFLLAMLTSVGCFDQAAGRVDSSRAEAVRSEPKEVNLGIVFAQRGERQVFSREDLGLPESDEFVSIESSCACVNARFVQYHSSSKRTRSAVEIVVESEDIPVLVPQRLRVQLLFTLSSGVVYEVCVDFLNTDSAEKPELAL